MEYINLDSWTTEGNKASISLLRLHAKFRVFKEEDHICYQLIVTDRNMETSAYTFYTLEDVMAFTQRVVSRSGSREEVTKKYQQMKEDGEFRLPNGLKPPKNDEMSLNPSEVIDAIEKYYGEGKNYRVSVRSVTYVDEKIEPHINFYMKESWETNGAKHEHEYMLTPSDINTALKAKAESAGYELINYQYAGGVHRVGLYVDENKVHYEGVQLKVRPKEKTVEEPPAQNGISQTKLSTKEVFETTGGYGREIARLHQRLNAINTKCFAMMGRCQHEIVFNYNDNYPKMLITDGYYYCPACGQTLHPYSKELLAESSFKDSRVIPLPNLSLFGTSDVRKAIRIEVYDNMEFYYDSNIPTIELTARMESVLKSKEKRYERPERVLQRKTRKSKKRNTETKE